MNLRDSSTGQIVSTSTIPPIPPDVTFSAAIGGSPGNGALSVTSVPLSSPTVSFQESYTAAESINLKATATVSGVLVSGASALITFSPDVFVKVLQLLPGETALPQGNTTATGKTGSASNQLLNAPFTITLKATDQYWNVKTGVTDLAQVATVPGGFFSGTTSSNFSAGVVNFDVAITTPYFSMTVQGSDAANPGITPQNSTVTVYGNYYFNVIVPASVSAGGPATYPVTIELRDQATGNLVGNNAIPIPRPTVTLTILESGSAGPGTTGVTSIPLSNNVVTFNESYTRAAAVTLRAQATVVNAVSGNSAPFTVIPSSYTQVLLLMPWDTPRTPGVPSATGKTGTPPSYILQGALQSVNARATDQYWNIVATAAGTARLDTIPSGFISGTNTQAFSSGLASFSVSIATVGYNIGIRADDAANGSITPQSESVNVYPPGLHYVISLATSVVMTPQTFSMQVTLEDGGGAPATYSTNTVTLATTQTTPASGVTLGTLSANLADGVATIPTQTISRTGSFKITATDSNGFTGTSALIAAYPENHRYQLVVPTAAAFGAPFSLQVERIDNATGLPVARNRTLAISAFFSDGTPLSPPASISLTSTATTLSPQSYPETYSEPNEFVTSRAIYFLVQPNLDGDNLSPYSTLSATSSIIQISPAAPASLSLKVTSPLTANSQQATLQSVLKSGAEPHRIPGQVVTFSILQGTGTLTPGSAVTDSSGTAQTVFSINATTSPTYAVQAAAGVLTASTTIALALPPPTILTASGPSQSDVSGSLLIKTDTLLSLTGVSNAGIATIELQTDGAPFIAYTGPFSLTLGRHSLSFYSTDVFGQVGPTSSQAVLVGAEGTLPGKLVNYPNPFQAGQQKTILEYNLPQASNVRLRVFNGTGEVVLEQNFTAGAQGGAAGLNQFAWDGTNGAGHVVSNGVYHAVVDSGWGRLDRTVVVIK